jgi:hypothetical protein
MAFFPCIYFCQNSMILFYYTNHNYEKLSHEGKMNKILERSQNRTMFYELLIKLVGVVKQKRLRLIIENPWTQPHFLNQNFLFNPSYIDKDRSRRGDYFVKPTAYWFINCEPTDGFTWQKDKKVRSVYSCASASHAGLCSEERSLISPDYAHNFICYQILGLSQKQKSKQLELFNAD